MNEEELLKILNKEKSYTEEDLLLFIYDLRKQNTELKDNWNKLKEFIKYNKDRFEVVKGVGLERIIYTKDLEEFMQEIEKGGMNE